MPELLDVTNNDPVRQYLSVLEGRIVELPDGKYLSVDQSTALYGPLQDADLKKQDDQAVAVVSQLGTPFIIGAGAGGGGATEVVVGTDPPAVRNELLLWVDTDEPVTSQGLLPQGGTTGQRLIKKSNSDYDAQWQDTPPLPFAAVSQSADISLANNTYTLLTWNTVIEDVSGFRNASFPSRLTVPAGLGGLYAVNLSVWFYSNATGGRYIRVLKNAAGVPGANSQAGWEDTRMGTPSLSTISSLSFVARLAAGDYIEAAAYQGSGAALNAIGASTNRFALTRLGS